MKKLMIAACAVAFAAASQAASIAWGVTDVGDSPKGEQACYYTAYTFLTVNGGATESGLAQVTMAQVQAWAEAGNWSAIAAASATDPFSVYVEGTSDMAVAEAWGGASMAEQITVKGFALIVDSDLIQEQMGTDTIENFMLTTEGSQTFKSNANLPLAVGATEWQAVPEPTSGLLLLLGVAGLALRRRRA